MNVHKKGILICPLPGCDRSYSHPSSMRKHMKTHGAAAKGVPLPQRVPEYGAEQSYYNPMGDFNMLMPNNSPPEPFRRRKKYNLSARQQITPVASPEHYINPVASSSPQYDQILANRSGSDSGVSESIDQQSPEHSMNDPFLVANMYYANLVQPIEQYQQFNPDQTTEQPANFDWNQYNQFAAQFAFNPAINSYWPEQLQQQALHQQAIQQQALQQQITEPPVIAQVTDDISF